MTFKLTTIGLLLLAVSAGGVYFFFFKEEEPKYEFREAKLGDIVQEVNVTGKVRPSESVDLSFEQTGRVTEVWAKVGDRVSAGEMLLRLNAAALEAELLRAEADIAAKRAKLDELRRGTREEDIRVQEAKVSAAEAAHEDAKKNVADKIEDAFTKADDAVRNRTDQLFSNPRGPSPQMNIQIADYGLKGTLEFKRMKLEQLLIAWRSSLVQPTGESNLAVLIQSAKTNLDTAKTYMDNTALVVNSLTPSTSISQATIDNYRADVSTGRTNINTAASNLTAAEEKLRSSLTDLRVKQEELLLKRAGQTQETIAAQEAEVRKTEAETQRIKAEIAKTTLRAPAAGLITKQEAKLGEIVAANLILVSIISDAVFEVEANIPEVDIGKVGIGNIARLTLDAYGSDVNFKTEVTSIDPGETIIEGVPTYKTKFRFIENDPRIRSGMTANINILTASKTGVIMVPQRAVIAKEGERFARLLEKEGRFREIKIHTGLAGSDGNIEVVEGLKEGDRVVTFVRGE